MKKVILTALISVFTINCKTNTTVHTPQKVDYRKLCGDDKDKILYGASHEICKKYQLNPHLDMELLGVDMSEYHRVRDSLANSKNIMATRTHMPDGRVDKDRKDIVRLVISRDLGTAKTLTIDHAIKWLNNKGNGKHFITPEGELGIDKESTKIKLNLMDRVLREQNNDFWEYLYLQAMYHFKLD